MELFVSIVIGAIIVFYFIGKNIPDDPNLTARDENKRNDFMPKIEVKISRADDSYQSDYNHDYTPPAIAQYWDDSEWVPVKAGLKLTYTNAKGETTERAVNITGYNGSAYLQGFCDLRNDTRTFRIDRIQKAIDTETGEVVDSLPNHLLKKYRQSPEYIIPKTFNDHIDVIKVLFYMGKADGQLRAAEREIICATIRSISKNKILTDEDINKFINRLEVPSMHGFKLAFGRVCKTYPKQTPTIYAITKKIIDTQKTVHANETEALEYMIKKMKKDRIQAPDSP